MATNQQFSTLIHLKLLLTRFTEKFEVQQI